MLYSSIDKKRVIVQERKREDLSQICFKYLLVLLSMYTISGMHEGDMRFAIKHKGTTTSEGGYKEIPYLGSRKK